MDAVQFRKAQPADLSIMQEVARRTIDRCYRSFLGNEGVDSFINNGESDRELQKHIEDCDVALKEDVIVGFSIYFDDLIHLMMADVRLHRTGIGSLLLVIHGILLDSLRLSEVAGFESLDVGLALPFPRKGIVAAGSFPKECHIRDPIPAAHANFGGGAGKA